MAKLPISMRSASTSTHSAGADGGDVPAVSVSWGAWRIIPSRFPPVDIYRRIAPPDDWPAIIEIETLTNPRVRELQEDLGLIRPEDKVGGARQNWNMAPFTYPDPEGSRFSDGSFGVSVQTEEFATALCELIRRREAFLHRTKEGPIRLDMRVLKTSLAGEFDDARNWKGVKDLEKCRELGAQRRSAGSNGILYYSDARPVGECIAVLRPRVLGNSVQERHLNYVWNGDRIEQAYDFQAGKRIDVQTLFATGQLLYLDEEPVGRR